MPAPPHAYTEFDALDTLPAILGKRAERTPDRVYVVDVSSGHSLTFGQAHELFLTWADAYRRLGVAAGDRVAVMLPNSFDAAAAWLGLGWVRALEVPINAAYRGYMLRYTLTNSGARTVIISERYLDQLLEVAADVDELATVVVPDATAVLPEIPGKAVVGRDEFLSDAQPARDLPVPMPWDVFGIMYTSGTTGPSKGVMEPWGMLTLGAVLLDDLTADDTFYSPFPMFHMSGKGGLSQAAYMGGRTVIREAFDTAAFWDDIDANGCTFTLMVPAMVHWMLAQPPSPADREHALQKALLSPIVPGFADRYGVSVRSHYGMTEAGNVMSPAP